MEEIRVIEIKQNIFRENEGSGKTTTLINLINRIKDKIKIAVMEADIDSDVDARKIKTATGIDTLQLHTGGMCHLDAEMTKQGLDELNLDGVDLVILENVGNLVCPAEFDTGAFLNVNILSVPEGDDKPLKYPLMYEVCDVVIVNKIDVAPYFDFNLDACKTYIHGRNKEAVIFPISAKNGEGVDALADWLINYINTYKKENRHA